LEVYSSMEIEGRPSDYNYDTESDTVCDTESDENEEQIEIVNKVDKNESIIEEKNSQCQKIKILMKCWLLKHLFLNKCLGPFVTNTQHLEIGINEIFFCVFAILKHYYKFVWNNVPGNIPVCDLSYENIKTLCYMQDDGSCERIKVLLQVMIVSEISAKKIVESYPKNIESILIILLKNKNKEIVQMAKFLFEQCKTKIVPNTEYFKCNILCVNKKRKNILKNIMGKEVSQQMEGNSKIYPENEKCKCTCKFEGNMKKEKSKNRMQTEMAKLFDASSNFYSSNQKRVRKCTDRFY